LTICQMLKKRDLVELIGHDKALHKM